MRPSIEYLDRTRWTHEDGDRAIDVIRAAAVDVVVTGHADLDTAVETLRNGAYDLLTKPLSDREIGCRALDDIRIREGLGRKPDLVTPPGEFVESGEVR